MTRYVDGQHQDTGDGSDGRDEVAGRDLPAVSTASMSADEEWLVRDRDDARAELEAMRAEIHPLRNELARLRAILTTPGTEDFMRDVEIEAAHQIDRWGTAHDAGKEPAERIHERGGFCYLELREHLGRDPETWVPAGTVAERER